MRISGVPSTEMQVIVYDLSGRQVHDSGRFEGDSYEWDLTVDSGHLVANGVYVCRAIAFGGQSLWHSPLVKLFVLK